LVDAEDRQGGTLYPGQVQKALQIEKQINTLKPQIATKKERLSAAETALAAAGRAQAETERKRRAVQRERTALSDRFKKQLGAQTEELTRAEQELRGRLADVTRRALALRGQVPFDDATLDRIMTADRTVRAAGMELETYRRAVDDYDPATYQRGILMASVLIGVLALLGAWMAI
jgi:chromosome segregation ATPase